MQGIALLLLVALCSERPASDSEDMALEVAQVYNRHHVRRSIAAQQVIFALHGLNGLCPLIFIESSDIDIADDHRLLLLIIDGQKELHIGATTYQGGDAVALGDAHRVWLRRLSCIFAHAFAAYSTKRCICRQ